MAGFLRLDPFGLSLEMSAYLHYIHARFRTEVRQRGLGDYDDDRLQFVLLLDSEGSRLALHQLLPDLQAHFSLGGLLCDVTACLGVCGGEGSSCMIGLGDLWWDRSVA